MNYLALRWASFFLSVTSIFFSYRTCRDFISYTQAADIIELLNQTRQKLQDNYVQNILMHLEAIKRINS